MEHHRVPSNTPVPKVERQATCLANTFLGWAGQGRASLTLVRKESAWVSAEGSGVLLTQQQGARRHHLCPKKSSQSGDGGPRLWYSEGSGEDVGASECCLEGV